MKRSIVRWINDLWEGRRLVAKTKHISVGVRKNGTVDLDTCDGDDEDWQFFNMSTDDAEFVIKQLKVAVEQARQERCPSPPEDEMPDEEIEVDHL